jgi:hypothetical protein
MIEDEWLASHDAEAMLRIVQRSAFKAIGTKGPMV